MVKIESFHLRKIQLVEACMLKRRHLLRVTQNENSLKTAGLMETFFLLKACLFTRHETVQRCVTLLMKSSFEEGKVKKSSITQDV